VWYLRASQFLDCAEVEEVEVLVQRCQKLTLCVRVQAPNELCDKVAVKLAQIAEVRRVWVQGVAVDRSVIAARLDRVGAKDRANVESGQPCANVGSEKAVGHPAILVESPRNVDIEIARGVAPVDEERDGEDGIGVGREVSRGDEGKLWIGGDGVLDALPS